MNPIDRRLEEELLAAVPHLRRWASRFATREYDADQLVQDTVVSFLERPEVYIPERGSLRNLLFASLKNKALDFSKSYNRIYKKEFRLYLKRRTKLFEMPAPANDLAQDGLLQEVERNLERMPQRLSEAFKLFAIEGKNHLEIAQIMNLSRGNVRLMLYRARIRLRGYLFRLRMPVA